MTYEWVTTFVIKHEAGSEEGAIHQRNQMDKAIEGLGGEVKMASTRPGDAADAGVAALYAAAEDEDDG